VLGVGVGVAGVAGVDGVAGVLGVAGVGVDEVTIEFTVAAVTPPFNAEFNFTIVGPV
jgi:hypothetical protein